MYKSIIKQACLYIAGITVLLSGGCKKEDDLVFSAPQYSGTINIKIEQRFTSNISRYTIKGFSAVIEKNEYGTPFFYIKGNDVSTNTTIVISGSAPTKSEARFNLAVSQGETTTLYKDCNQGRVTISEGTDSKGSFTRITIPPNECMTATLKGDRFSAEPYYNLISDPIKIYNQE